MTILLLFGMAGAALPLAAAKAPEHEAGKIIHVSPAGSHEAVGEAASPVDSVERAWAMARAALAQDPAADVEIVLDGGRYELAEPIRIGEEAAGEGAIVFRAAEGARPVVSGGRELGGWERVEGDLWACPAPGVAEGEWWFRDLFRDGERQTRARFPNFDDEGTPEWLSRGGWRPEADNLLVVESRDPNDTQTLTLESAFPGNLAGQDAEVMIFNFWSTNRGRIESGEGRTFRTAARLGSISQPQYYLAAPGRRLFLEHAREFIDQPGEWWLDRDAGRLYYQSAAGDDPNDSVFMAPRLEQLVVIEGTPDRPARNVHFRGIEFAHAAWVMPEQGFNGTQAGWHYNNQGDHYAWFDPAIELTYSHDVSLEFCGLRETGGDGIGIGRGCRDVLVRGCAIEEIGITGLRVFDHDQTTVNPPPDLPADDIIKRIELSHNTVRLCGQVIYDGIGILQGFAPETVISHNLVERMPYTGISVGWGWHDRPTIARDVIVSYNLVRDVLRIMNDGAGIYTLGNQPGTVIRNNFVHDVHNGNSIYTDAGSSYISVLNNVLWRSGEALYKHHHGEFNVVRNNIFAQADEVAIIRHREDVDDDPSFFLERNIIWMDRGGEWFHGPIEPGDAILNRAWGNNLYRLDKNVYWDAREIPLTFAGRTLKEWQAEGQDVQSVIADPGFADVAAGDFTLAEDSPARALGFEPIDLSEVGPQLDGLRAE